MKKLYALVAGLLFATPLLGFAQTGSTGAVDTQNIGSALSSILALINNILIPLIIAIAIIAFLFGLVKYVTSGGNEDQRKEARNTIIYGIIVLAVMFSIYGLIRFITRTFGLNNQQQELQTPTTPGPYGGRNGS